MLNVDAAFEHDETPDQLDAIRAIRDDLQQSRPMDRLLCGDVGFGKTEVALRAAFTVAVAGKQVLMLSNVPRRVAPVREMLQRMGIEADKFASSTGTLRGLDLVG